MLGCSSVQRCTIPGYRRRVKWAKRGGGLQHSLPGRGSNARELLAITIITYIIYYLHYGMHCCIITIRFNVWYAMKGGYAYPTNCWGWGWGPLFFLAAVYHQFSAPSVPVTLDLLKNDRRLKFFISPGVFPLLWRPEKGMQKIGSLRHI